MNITQTDERNEYPSPGLFMLLVAASIFTVETALMFLLGNGGFSETWLKGMLDAFLLTLFLLPVYYLMYRPFKAQIEKRSHMALQVKMNNELLAVIVEAQREFIAHGREAALFDKMLERLVMLTRSKCGCIMEARTGGKAVELAVRSSAGECGGNAMCGWEQPRERALMEDVMSRGAPVATDFGGGRGAFLGFPLYGEGRVIGVLSVTGREEAYSKEIMELTRPFVETCAGLLEACHAEAHRRRNEERMKAARDQAEESLRIKDRFVSLVAHDLKEPLAAILLSLNYLQRGREMESAPHRDKLVGYMTRTTRDMVHLVDELLVQGRIHMGKIAPRFTDAYVRTIAGVALSRVEAQAAAKGVRLLNEVPDGASLHCDPELITEVVVNFLANAVKFTPAGGSATIFVPNNGNMALSVRDTGVGLDRARIDELLTPGVFASSQGTAGEKGTGIGIPLCIDILKAHGGELHIESEKGKGSTFSIALGPEIPVARAV